VKTTRMMAVAVLMVGTALALHAFRAQQVGINRKDLQRHDLSAPGREVVQVRVQIDPGTTASRWSIKSRASRR
jgi:hypothetical protein